MKNKKINVVGTGLAGCEIAYQLAKTKRGLSVNLYEVKQVKKNPVQNLDSFVELVCSNSFRSKSIENASGILKEELKILDSLIIKAALASAIPVDDALTVDHQLFSNYELITSSTVTLKEFEKYFKGCQLIELLAKQSKKVLLNGSMSPNHLEDDQGNLPFAVMQLRKDNLIDTLYNIVGWQTNLTLSEQKKNY
ncbi:hypothetical protein P344_01190 [Spiroplasma mirum ATCC 29335]|uniref:MnmG N-terminal domain-containing protein n=1 Tax=Spiroplasma mirum ATCC 29335 TaxID=838561 RepID=W6AV82_9MOLU|nr:MULTISPECIES: FAD-dependent oxidoreductase [Spiroplasma]AHI57604.1 hypothetical protein P344_01190 [Spiroplasma mirum ATCC 29335]